MYKVFFLLVRQTYERGLNDGLRRKVTITDQAVDSQTSPWRGVLEKGDWACLQKGWVLGKAAWWGPRGRPAALGVRATGPAMALHHPSDLLNLSWCYFFKNKILFLLLCHLSTHLVVEFSSCLPPIFAKQKSTRTYTRRKEKKTSYEPTFFCSFLRLSLESSAP